MKGIAIAHMLKKKKLLLLAMHVETECFRYLQLKNAWERCEGATAIESKNVFFNVVDRKCLSFKTWPDYT